jgi:hypothetical protein
MGDAQVAADIAHADFDAPVLGAPGEGDALTGRQGAGVVVEPVSERPGVNVIPVGTFGGRHAGR